MPPRNGTPVPFTPTSLKDIREKRGLTQAEVARRMNLSQPRICQIEHDWETTVTMPNLRAYFGAMGLKLTLVVTPTTPTKKGTNRK